ncbi:uncharacterized protein G2W53_015495 [Senna tora]|uniref:Transposase n=1 Tax=Senna tora TaxID=362788 RepID=A0A835CA07_9FABA|nr:uncharacterized protein G2W53_015495 [Senna tora]
MSFAEFKQLIHHTLKLPQNQEVLEIIYRMPYGRNPVNFLSAEVFDDEGMGSILHCHMQCLKFLPIPMIVICANTSTAMQPFEVPNYIPHIEFNRRGDQECGTSQAFEGDDINEDSLEMAREMLNMLTAEPNDELLDDEEFDALTGNDIEDLPNGVEYEDEDFDDNNDAQSLCNVPPNPYDDEWSADGGEVWNETSNLKKGLTFPNKKSLGEAVKIFSFKRHVNYSVTRSRGKSYEVTCAKHDNGCPWRVRACLKVNLGMWLITKYEGNHSCATPSMSQDRSKLNSDIIVGLNRGIVERSADVPMSQIVQRVKDEYQFTVLYRKAWLGKQKALAMVYGNWEASYDTLRRWMRAVQHHLPGTIIPFQHRPIPDNVSDVQFHRLFWAFEPCIDAWPHLKPVIQVDSTFLYGKYHHTLLIAMGQDGNRNIVPLAFAIAEGETKEAWAWFLFRVREFVVGRQEGVCLIFDRSTGCLAAVEDEAVGWQPPLGHHVYCIRHVASNFNTKFRSNPLKKLLKNAFLTVSVLHVLAVCSYLNHEYELYVDPTYKLQNIVAAYSYPFHPITGEEYWPEVPGQRLKPNPAALRPPGCPRSTRIHNEMDWKEQGEKPKCNLCWGEGHNKNKCPNKKPISIPLMQLGSPSSFTQDTKLSVIWIAGAVDVAYRVHCDPLVQRGSVSSVMALVLFHPMNVTSWFEFKGWACTPLVQLWKPCISYVRNPPSNDSARLLHCP